MEQTEFEQVVRLVTEEVLRYLNAPGGSRVAGADRDDEICSDCDLNCAENAREKRGLSLTPVRIVFPADPRCSSWTLVSQA